MFPAGEAHMLNREQEEKLDPAHQQLPSASALVVVVCLF